MAEIRTDTAGRVVKSNRAWREECEELQKRVKELEAKAEMDYAIIAGDAALITGLKEELAAANRGAERNAHINRELAQELAALKAKGENMHDKNGTEIKAGDTLFNPHDRDQYHTVLQDGDGRLFLGDFDSPLERYAPQTWWEVTHNT